MDYFEDDGIDNHALLAQMVHSANGYVDAYLQLSKPIKKWLDDQYEIAPGLPVGLMAMHVELATQYLSELMGVDEPED